MSCSIKTNEFNKHLWSAYYMARKVLGLFTRAKTWKQPQCSPTDTWIKKMWWKDTTAYHPAKINDKRMPFAAT